MRTPSLRPSSIAALLLVAAAAAVGAAEPKCQEEAPPSSPSLAPMASPAPLTGGASPAPLPAGAPLPSIPAASDVIGLPGSGPAGAGSRCSKCSDDKQRCLECWPMHGPDAAGQCVTCEVDMCVDCSSDGRSCQRCADGMGLVGGACQPCTDPTCMRCQDDAARCTACIPGTGVYLDAGAGLCRPCPQPGCMDCPPAVAGGTPTNVTRCRSCRTPGYVLDELMGRCMPCPPNCQDCSSTGPKKCATCAPGFRLDPQQLCQPCADPACVACEAAADKCTTCGRGQEGLPLPEAGLEVWEAFASNGTVRTGVDRATGVCVPCADPACLNCATNANACTMCMPGHRRTNGTCVACTDLGCRYCQLRAFPPGAEPGGDLADVYGMGSGTFGSKIPDDWVLLEVCSSCMKDGWQPVNGSCVPPPPAGTPPSSPEPVGGLPIYEPLPVDGEEGGSEGSVLAPYIA